MTKRHETDKFTLTEIMSQNRARLTNRNDSTLCPKHSDEHVFRFLQTAYTQARSI